MKSWQQNPELLLSHVGWVRALARHLVQDPNLADDIAQDTWLAALKSRPDGDRPLQPWLRRVLRNVAHRTHRQRVRRWRREREAARPEALPSAAELHERASLQRALVDAVLRLEDPYGTTVLLRYFEGLPPREIARRLGVPVETVRTRTKRALDMLRARLDEEHGGERAAWCTALWPLVAAKATTTLGVTGAGLKSVLLGVLTVSTKLKAGLVALLTLAAFLAVWQGIGVREKPFHSGRASSGVEEAPTAGEGAPPEAAREPEAQDSPAAERQVLNARSQDRPPSATQPYGSLLIHVVWSRDRSPAANVGVVCIPARESNRSLHEFRGQTDSQGTVLVERIRAGSVAIQPVHGGLLKTSVRAGERTDVTIEIPAGMTVEGLVEDFHGNPVPSAEVWMSEDFSPFTVGHVVTHVAADGTFRICDVSEWRYLGARAPGFSPSALVALLAKPGATLSVRLVLPARGGAVTGRVLDSTSQPLADALVLLGSEGATTAIRLAGGLQGVLVLSQRTRTDAEGRFAFLGAAAGMMPLVATMPGWAPWSGKVEVREGTTTPIDIHLARGQALTGMVRDPEDGAVADVEIGTGDPWSLTGVRTRSAEDGSYRLEDLAAGEITVSADGGDKGRDATTLEVRCGEDAVWNPVLTRGEVISGRVLDEADRPLEDHSVRAYSVTGGAIVNARTDARGHFVLENCYEAVYKVGVFAPEGGSYPIARVESVRPGLSELLIRVLPENRPSAFIEGVVVDPRGGRIGSALVKARGHGPGMSDDQTETDGEGGSFRLGPMPPGCYSVEIYAKELPTLRVDGRELLRGETWDVGRLTMQAGGRLVATLSRSDGGRIDHLSLLLFDAEGHTYRVTQKGNEAQSDPLAPGNYELRATEGGMGGIVFFPVRFAITDAEAVRLEYVLRPGVLRSLLFVDERDPASRGDSVARVRVWDESGQLVREALLDLSGGGGPSQLTLTVAVGTYRVEVQVGDVSLEHVLEVPELSPQRKATEICIE
ncbi:MAG: sigma-70 family RNA polymerase sigma factor [Planctomycetota bacterium]